MSRPGKDHLGRADVDVEFDSVLSGQIASFDNMFDGKTEHAENAIDFSDEDELADEEDVNEQTEHRHSNIDDDDDIFGENDLSDDDDDDDDNFMKELQNEAMEGVEQNDTALANDAVFGVNLPDNLPVNAGLQDLDFASNSLLDISKQIGDSDIELSDDDNAAINNLSSVSQQKFISPEEKLRIQQEKKRELEERNKIKRETLVKIFFPTFKQGKEMRLQELFPIVPLDFSYSQPPPIKTPLLPKSTHFEIDDDKSKEFKMSTKKLKEHNKLIKKPNLFIPDVKIVKIEKSDLIQPSESTISIKKEIKTISYDTNLIISTAEWNDEEIFEANDEIELLPPAKRLKVEGNLLDAWDDDDDNMIFEGHLDLDSINLKLDMNDPNLIFMNKENENKPYDHHINNNAIIPSNQKLLEARFNISNDKEYELLKGNYQTKIRAMIGTLTIDHTPPAIRLQSPYYKVKPSAKENRTYHRTRFSVKPNVTIQFSKPKIRKKKRDKGKEISELFGKTTDLSLGDTAPFFLNEYSEEFPLSLNKFGMGSKVINYYRKRSDDDNTRPKLSLGETHVLGVQDRSPFWNFGHVEKGSIVPTLYNKLVRAPLFQHEPFSTDFLFIKSSGGGSGQRFYLRPVNFVFTVGQTLPATEVPGPHSRRATAIMKHRLKMVAYRALNLNENTRITVKDISEHFPKQSDMQIRQRLKEFMEYQRGGPDQGYWRLKNADKLPDFDQIRRMMSPEDACVLEVMMWGQQKFDDVDMFRRERLQSVQEESNKKDKDGNNEETLAQQLAPWNTTRNFIQATQGKAMLQIFGDGDPSKSGEGMSFLKISMKGGFIKNVENKDSKPGTPAANGNSTSAPNSSIPHSYNVAMQQKLYDEQINKVWYKQARSLSKYRNTDKPRIVELDELTDQQSMQRANREVDEEVNEKPRYLKITRMVKNVYGIKERIVQVIKDPKVVELYVKKKQEQLLETSGSADGNAIVITNDEEENMKVKKRLEEELAKLEKQAEKKKKKQPGITAANIDSEGRISGKGIGKGKSTSRRCATCGSLGHIRTNKTCPLYFTVHNKSNPNYIPGSEKGVELLKQQGLVAAQPSKPKTPLMVPPTAAPTPETSSNP